MTEEGNWEEFEEWVSKLKLALSNSHSSPLLFRGQSDSSLDLTSTLERNVGGPIFSFTEYEQLIIGRVGPSVKSFANVEIPEYSEDRFKSYENMDGLSFGVGLLLTPAVMEYMVYLRHHGFPSPLLDWSRSQYVAAFFAFRNVDKSSHVRSIYIYCETPTGITSGRVGEPTIKRTGNYIPAHHRHFWQQSDYTICASYESNRWQYDSHQKVFNNRLNRQDLLWKFNIPSSERMKVLKKLDQYNLNAYSLMGSEESLLETLWMREVSLRGRG